MQKNCSKSGLLLNEGGREGGGGSLLKDQTLTKIWIKLQNAYWLVTCSKPNIGLDFHQGKEKWMGGSGEGWRWQTGLRGIWRLHLDCCTPQFYNSSIERKVFFAFVTVWFDTLTGLSFKCMISKTGVCRWWRGWCLMPESITVFYSYHSKGSHPSKNTGILWNTFKKWWPPRTAFMKSSFRFSH